MPAHAHRVFLLSPANAGGVRAQMLLNDCAKFELATRLQRGAASIGEVFTFVSSLYFRGKLAYSCAFANPPDGAPPAVVISPGRGLLSLDTSVTLDDFREMASVPIDLAEPRYLTPLVRDASALDTLAGPECCIVLLGSIATAKYVTPLVDIFGERLLFPAEFIGRGDMSRGGLMLRSAVSGSELTYVPVAGAVRHGPRPPRLPRLR